MRHLDYSVFKYLANISLASKNKIIWYYLGVTSAVMKYYDQSNLERRGFIWLTLPDHCSSSKEVRIGTQNKAEI